MVTSGLGAWLDGVRESTQTGRTVVRGGAALLSSRLRLVRQNGGGDVLYIDTGSLVGESGGGRQPERAMRALKALGCAAVALGEEDAATASADGDGVPIVSVDSVPPEIDGYKVLPSVRVVRDHVQIAIVGGSPLHEGVSLSRLRRVAGAIFQEVVRARRDGAQLVIVAVHAAGTCTTLARINTFVRFNPTHCDQDSPLLALTHELASLSKKAPDRRIDLVVGGHGPGSGVSAVIDGIPVVAPTADGMTLSEVGLMTPWSRMTNQILATDSLVPPRTLCSARAAYGPCGRHNVDVDVVRPDQVILKLLEQTR